MNRGTQNAVLIKNLIAQSGLPRNQVAALSGLSNAHIRELEKGALTNVGRDKLIALAVALSLDLKTIDQLLKAFDRTPLTEEDVPLFLGVAEKSKLSTVPISVRDMYTLELHIGTVEKAPGRHVLVSVRPTESFKEEGHRRYQERHMAKQHPVYEKLNEAIFRRRREAVLENASHYNFDQYICKSCLTEYLTMCQDQVEKSWRVRHILNTISYIDKIKRFNFYLTESCPSFIFVMKLPDLSAGESEQLILINLPSHLWKPSRSGLISGFITLNKELVNVFKREIEIVEGKVDENLADRGKLIRYLEELVETNKGS